MSPRSAFFAQSLSYQQYAHTKQQTAASSSVGGGKSSKLRQLLLKTGRIHQQPHQLTVHDHDGPSAGAQAPHSSLTHLLHAPHQPRAQPPVHSTSAPHFHPMASYENEYGSVATNSDSSDAMSITKDVFAFNLTFQYSQQVQNALSAFVFLLGFLLLTAGQRFFKTLLLALTWLLAGLCIFILTALLSHNTTLAFILGMTIGLALALTVMFVYKLALLVLSVGCGVVVWNHIQALIPIPLDFTSSMVLLVAMIIVCMGLLYVLKNYSLMVGTSLLGCFLILQVTLLLLGINASLFHTVQWEPNGAAPHAVQWPVYVIYACGVLVTIAGIYTQYRYTSTMASKATSSDKEDEDEAAGVSGKPHNSKLIPLSEISTDKKRRHRPAYADFNHDMEVEYFEG